MAEQVADAAEGCRRDVDGERFVEPQRTRWRESQDRSDQDAQHDKQWLGPCEDGRGFAAARRIVAGAVNGCGHEATG